MEWFQGWESGRPPAAREANFVIVVDAGGQLERVDRRIGWARSVRRSQAVQYRQSRASRTRWFVDALLAQTARGFIVPISAEPRAFRPPAGRTVPTGVADDALPEGFAAPLAGLRTDLDRFTKTEAALLSYHGYWSTHVRMATLHPEFAVGSPSWTEFAKLSNVDAQRFRKQLARGAKMRPVRFSR